MAAIPDYLLVFGLTFTVCLILTAAVTRPLFLSANATFGEVARWYAEVRWWQLGVRYAGGEEKPLRFILFSGEIPFSISESAETDVSDHPEDGGGAAALLPIVRQIPAVWPYFSHFLSRAWHLFSLDRLEITGTFGTGDPALTGTIFGWCWAIRAILWPQRNVQVKIDADFEKKRLEGSISAEIKVRFPSVILIRAIAMVRHQEVRMLLKSLQEEQSA